MKWIFAIAFFFAAAASAATASSCADDDFAKSISKGLPSGAPEIINRILECKQGDKKAGGKENKCDSLEKDRLEFTHQHANNPKVLTAFTAAESWNGSCD